jgi:hypothetical protein
VNVREGQHVKAGDVLFRVDPKPFQIAVDSAKAQLELTRLNIESMKQDYKRILSDIAGQQAQVELAKANYERAEALVKSGSTSKANYDQMRYAYESGQKHLQALKDQAKVQLDKLNGNPDIDAKQHVTLFDVLAFLDVDLRHDAGNIGRDHELRRMHIGVVGRDIAPAHQPERRRGDRDKTRAAEHQRQAKALAVFFEFADVIFRAVQALKNELPGGRLPRFFRNEQHDFTLRISSASSHRG